MTEHIIEHRRVKGGDWIKIQTVHDEDLTAYAEEIVARYNEESGANDWRIRPLNDTPARQKPPMNAQPDKPSWWDRFRFWWIMKTSPRG